MQVLLQDYKKIVNKEISKYLQIRKRYRTFSVQLLLACSYRIIGFIINITGMYTITATRTIHI